MTASQKLHAFARQVCMDRFRRWTSAYEPIAEQQRKHFRLVYSDEAYRIFPRYNVDTAVLHAIEMLEPDDLPAFDTLKLQLADAAQTAGTPFTARIDNAIHNAAMTEERDWLSQRFSGLTPDDVADQKSLSYRRVLKSSEVDGLQTRLKDQWGREVGYWYPLAAKTHPSLIFYNLSDVDEPALQELTKEFLRKEGVGRIFELREFNTGYELDWGGEEFFYNGEEGFWFGHRGNWIVYCSHENTITFGGKLAEHVALKMQPASDPA
jgi:hypothetical protein